VPVQVNGMLVAAKQLQQAAQTLHAFLNSHGGATGWMMARIGMKYHEPSASDTRARILAFLVATSIDSIDASMEAGALYRSRGGARRESMPRAEAQELECLVYCGCNCLRD
jgi:hypothetical protein